MTAPTINNPTGDTELAAAYEMFPDYSEHFGTVIADRYEFLGLVFRDESGRDLREVEVPAGRGLTDWEDLVLLGEYATVEILIHDRAYLDLTAEVAAFKAGAAPRPADTFEDLDAEEALMVYLFEASRIEEFVAERYPRLDVTKFSIPAGGTLPGADLVSTK